MPKIIPPCPKKTPGKPQASPPYSIEVLTPMVGGGVIAGETDLTFPIRPTAIRGHLRHWWRLTVGQPLGSGMWQREEEVFGSTEFASPLEIRVPGWSRVDQFDPRNRDEIDRYRGQFGPAAYAMFASIENKHRVAKEGIRFDLSIHTPTVAELSCRRAAQNEARRKSHKELLPSVILPIVGDIETALRAWLAFGGLGGRTRRGCGAVHCKTLTEKAGPLPSVPARVFVGKETSTAKDAWMDAVQAYRDFRQTPRGGKHKKTIQTRTGPKEIIVPGRSHWPEADSIRQISGCSLKPPRGTTPSGVPADEDTHDHSTPVVAQSLLPSFPKALLGLPINFHFADGPNKGPAAANLDPKDVQLYPLLRGQNGTWEKAERMASPVITRPLWIAGKWHPAMIVLAHPLPPGFRVRVEGKNAALGGNLSRDLQPDQIADARLGGLTPMRRQANAVDALIEFLTKEQNWRKL